MSKVILTREQADALEYLKKEKWNNEKIIEAHTKTKHIAGHSWFNKTESLNALSIEELVIAVLISYEVEQTPEEKLLQEYLFNKKNVDPKVRCYADGMKDAVTILGITIPGMSGYAHE